MFFRGKCMRNLLAHCCVAAVMATAAPSMAASTFIFDESASSITVTNIGQGCVPGSCTLSASFSHSAAGWSWTPAAEGDVISVPDFIDWEIQTTNGRFGFPPTGGGLYDVSVNLAFSSPEPASSLESGRAGFVTVLGAVSGGFVTWSGGGEGVISFADGSKLAYNLEGALTGGLGKSASTGIEFTAVELAPVPLPAAGVLLLAAIGGMGVLRRRKG